MIVSSPSSNPNARVGKLSVTRLIHSIWMAVIGTGNQIMKLKITLIISSKFTASINLMNFLILSYTVLPCLIVWTIVAKLSSSNTISDASLVTSVPVIPIAKPMSAALSAAASLTPSQVMTTWCPSFFRPSQIITFCAGVTLAKIFVVFRSSNLFSAASNIAHSIASPVSPISWAMAFAVSKWSQVIIITLIPAW